jgi:hypothetical protein
VQYYKKIVHFARGTVYCQIDAPSLVQLRRETMWLVLDTLVWLPTISFPEVGAFLLIFFAAITTLLCGYYLFCDATKVANDHRVKFLEQAWLLSILAIFAFGLTL